MSRIGRVEGCVARVVRRQRRGVLEVLWLAFMTACGSGGSAKSASERPPVELSYEHNLIRNADFEEGSLPWQGILTEPAAGSVDVVDGALCLTMDHQGKNTWDVHMKHTGLVMEQGHSYTIHFRAWSSAKTTVNAKVGMTGPPYVDYWKQWTSLSPEPLVVEQPFDMKGPTDRTAELTFHVGGELVQAVPMTICIDDLYLIDPQFMAPDAASAAPVPKIAVNQNGYLPSFDKIAVLASSATQPVAWQLIDATGAVVTQGLSSPVGEDEYSGNSVHHIDFTSVSQEGEGFVVKAGDEASHPFDISSAVYSKLKYDALAYFYHNRSGIEVAMPYAGHEQWTRPAAHLPDKAPCAADIGCEYTLDVTKGWYDAGDHGKYVVNGGISAWTLQNQWERLKFLGKSVSAFADGRMQIPENSNGFDDLLDEARWEVEFMLAMQAPAGTKNAGMVHHKMHDEGWTPIPLRPDLDTLPRTLRPVSTAATLNMAAVAAQASRLWKKLDKAFARQSLAAAETAYAAAKANPGVYASPKDGNNGGGPYDDEYVLDEFYWAAAELYVTTGKKAYWSDLKSNPHHKAFKQADNRASIMSWQTVDALGAITLATVPSKLRKKDRKKIRKRIVAVADLYLKNQAGQGYRTPYAGNEGKYEWGSNSFVATNAMVLALAYDFTKKDEYRRAVGSAMDYILGTNPLGQSYITGYGELPLRNPHHRFWAQQAQSEFPPPPPGALSGGPNSELQDPYVQAAGLKKRGCAPQKCFIDNIQAWSVNEITINWNSPLAWVASFLDEQAAQEPHSH